MWTPAALEIIAHPKTLLLKCRLRVQLPKNPSPKSLDSRIQTWPMEKPPLRPALMNQGRSPTKIKRKSILKRSKTGKTLFRLKETMPLRVRRSRTIEVTKSTIIVKRKAILLGTARNLQKTSVSLGNLHIGEW